MFTYILLLTKCFLHLLVLPHPVGNSLNPGRMQELAKNFSVQYYYMEYDTFHFCLDYY